MCEARLRKGLIFFCSCNWLGGEAVAEEINAKGYSCAGYTDISTSDDVVHGQVKQAGNFSFVRIYESGYVIPPPPLNSQLFLFSTYLQSNSANTYHRHEVPFYSPVAALEIFERAISGKE